MTEDKEAMRRVYQRLHANDVLFHISEKEMADIERHQQEWAQAPGEWIVALWSGRITDMRRVAFKGPEDEARMEFQKLSAGLRQGIVALVNPDGDAVEQSSPTDAA
jgi:hypothetical protein